MRKTIESMLNRWYARRNLHQAALLDGVTVESVPFFGGSMDGRRIECRLLEEKIKIDDELYVLSGYDEYTYRYDLAADVQTEPIEKGTE